MPASPQTLSLYVAHLFDRLEFSSINNYLAALAQLHLNHNFAPPDLSHPLVKSALEGARRQKAEYPHQKAGINAKILWLIAAHLKVIEQPLRDLFWAAALVAFFSLLRSANLFSAPRNTRYLRSSDVKINGTSATLTIQVLKTSRFKDSLSQLCLPRVTDAKFCPVFWMQRIMRTENVCRDDPLFSCRVSAAKMS